MRPIDADALMKEMYHRAFETDEDTMWQSGCWVRYRAVEQVVKAQPTIDPWIQVSERLPDPHERVLVTVRHDETDYIAVDILRYYSDGTWECEEYGTVLAWAPLPKKWGGAANG